MGVAADRVAEQRLEGVWGRLEVVEREAERRVGVDERGAERRVRGDDAPLPGELPGGARVRRRRVDPGGEGDGPPRQRREGERDEAAQASYFGFCVGGGATTVTVTFDVTPAPDQPLVNGKVGPTTVATPEVVSICRSDAGAFVPPS